MYPRVGFVAINLTDLSIITITEVEISAVGYKSKNRTMYIPYLQFLKEYEVFYD